jgi:DNA-binding NarL/FixJ family response regulator
MTIEFSFPQLQKITYQDDHPLLYKGTKMRLQDTIQRIMSFITEAKDCESAYNVITNPESDVFDIAFLDISMPPYEIRVFIQVKMAN